MLKEGKEVVYVAGPIAAPSLSVVRSNIERARLAGAWLILKDKAPVIPHSNLDGLERYIRMSWKDLMRVDLPILKKCDSVYMLFGWEKSHGAKVEHWLARRMGKPIYYQERDVEFLLLKGLFFNPNCRILRRDGGKNVQTDADFAPLR